MKIGFENCKERLLKFDRFQDQFSQRKLFLEFFNLKVESELRFSKDEILLAKKHNLCEIFKIKIVSLLDVSFVPYIKKSSSKFQGNKTKIKFFNSDIQYFLNKCAISKNLRKSIKNDKLASKLFEIIGGAKLTFKIDAQECFKEFIYERLLKENKNRVVNMKNRSIDMIFSKDDDIKIFPYWNIFESKNQFIDEHIENAVDCIKNSNFKNIYLVYPKNSNLERHIDIKIAEFENKKIIEYGIKIIPYSLRSILK